MSSTGKIGFWALVSIVLSSQIGSGALILPASLAYFGSIGLMSWLFTGGGAILLALIFSDLSMHYPLTGGPHVYVEKAFGRKAAFFTAWSYWMFSWMSTSAVIIASVGYASILFGGFSKTQTLILETILLLLFTSLNLKGVRASGYVEIIFTVLKIVPLILLPLFCIPYFNTEHFSVINNSNLTTLSALNAAVMLTFWGFIGVESATTPAGSVDNPTRTIPKATIFGTMLVAAVYLFSSTMIMGLIPLDELQQSKAPFADAAKILFGGNWYILIALAATIVCFGTLNAWILISGQIALGASKDKLFPQFFGKVNSQGAPSISLMISCFATIPLLIISSSDNLVEQFNVIIDTSVTAFLMIYIVCIVSYIKLIAYKNRTKLVLAITAFAFCMWVLTGSSIISLLVPIIICLLGIPIYKTLNIKNS